MDQSDIRIGDVGKLLRKVVDDWRLEQRKHLRHRRLDFDDRFDALDARTDKPGSDDMRANLQEMRELFESKLDDRHAMIDEAHRQMIEHLERSKQDAH